MKYSYYKHIFNKLFGFYQSPYCEKWNEELNKILDEEKGEIWYNSLSRAFLLIKFQNCEVWIGNKFYSFGTLYTKSGTLIPKEYERRPSFKTINRLNDRLEKLKKEYMESIG